MILESLILPVIANVLGDYISSVMTKKYSEKTRSEMEHLIRAQVAALQSIHDEARAMSIAMRELALVVRGAAVLDWRDNDVLVIAPHPSMAPALAHINPQDALRQLRSSVDERRRVLGLPEGLDHETPEPVDKDSKIEPGDITADPPSTSTHVDNDPEGSKTDQADLVRTATPMPAVLVPAPGPTETASPANQWRNRVITLQQEVTLERRRRMKDD